MASPTTACQGREVGAATDLVDEIVHLDAQQAALLDLRVPLRHNRNVPGEESPRD